MALEAVNYTHAGAAFLSRQPAMAFAPLRNYNWEWQLLRNHLEQRLGMQRNIRLSWFQHWQLLAAYILPRRSLWLQQPVPNSMNRGLPINENIIDPTGTLAMRVCAAGLMSGMCSPSRPWFKLGTAIDQEADQEATEWFEEVEQRVYAVMAGSNYYDSKAQQYEDLVVFATAPKIIYEDDEEVIRCYNPCAGEYYLSVDGTGRVDGMARLFNQTVSQTVGMFGLENCPQDIQAMWQTKGANVEVERIIAHMIEPNYPISARGAPTGGDIGVIKGDFAYRELYWVWGTSCDQPLSRRGFKDKPFTSPRWATTSNDPYGRGVGMDCLPDIMQLQKETIRKAQGIEKQVNPPLLADIGMKNEPSSTLPGHVTYAAGIGADKGMRPIYMVDPKLEHMTADIKEIQQRIQRGFFNDLFLMISGDDKTNRTAYEIAQRQNEKLQVLGPVIERLQNEDLSPDIKRILNIMARKQLLPPQPKSLQGIPLKIEYISMLALAQKAAATAGMDRLAAMVGRIGGVKPEMFDIVNWEKFIREYADDVAVPHKIMTPTEQFAAMMQQKQQQAAAQRQAQQVAQAVPVAADAAKNLSDTDLGGGINALQMMLGGGQPQ